MAKAPIDTGEKTDAALTAACVEIDRALSRCPVGYFTVTERGDLAESRRVILSIRAALRQRPE